MGKRKNPDTSIDAYNSLNPIKISQTMQKIVETLNIIGKGSYELIAEHAGMPEQRVWKRLIDCVRARLIHDTGERTKTKSGHPCRVFAAGPGTAEVEHKKKVMKGPTVQEFAKAINQVQPSKNIINRLF